MLKVLPGFTSVRPMNNPSPTMRSVICCQSLAIYLAVLCVNVARAETSAKPPGAPTSGSSVSDAGGMPPSVLVYSRFLGSESTHPELPNSSGVWADQVVTTQEVYTTKFDIVLKLSSTYTNSREGIAVDNGVYHHMIENTRKYGSQPATIDVSKQIRFRENTPPGVNYSSDTAHWRALVKSTRIYNATSVTWSSESTFKLDRLKTYNGTRYDYDELGQNPTIVPYEYSYPEHKELTGAYADAEIAKWAEFNLRIFPLGYTRNDYRSLSPDEYSQTTTATTKTIKVLEVLREWNSQHSFSGEYGPFDDTQPAVAFLQSPTASTKKYQKVQYKFVLPQNSTAVISWFETFTPTGASQPTVYVFQTWTPGEQIESPLYTIDPLGLDPTDANAAKRQPTVDGTWTIDLNVASLAVDANRDGTIKLASEDASDATSAEKPYRFWLNDDDDNGGDIIGTLTGDDTPGVSSPDGQQVKVQGTRDLVDFFPVFLDIKQLLAALPAGAGAKCKLKNADDGLRFVYTDLARTDAFKYLKDFATGSSLKEADAHWVTAEGYELDAIWLGQVKDADKGVILVEGRNATDKPLVLSVEKTDGTVIAEVKLELKIVPVETMFRHLNLHDRNLAGLVGAKDDSAQPEAMYDPTGFPDDPDSDARWLIFVHGFNVNGRGSRGWNAEMFKRCYWSQYPDKKFFKSRFVGVSWFGSPDQVGGAISDYHLAMRNAMVTAPVLSQVINNLEGSATTKTLFAHSLGCGVISSAIADHGMDIGRVCFVDAALALECFDGRDPDAALTEENKGMRPEAWKDYDPKLYAANWYKLFDASDSRSKLTWNNRFTRNTNGQKDVSSFVYHFYSSTEDILADYTEELPSTLGGVLWAPGHVGTYGWVFQEKGKGNRQNYSLLGLFLHTHLGSYYGGWGMNIKDPLFNDDVPYWKWSETYLSRVLKAPDEIGNVSDNILRRHPVFEPGWGVVRNQGMQEVPVSNRSPVDGAPSWILDVYDASLGNTIATDPLKRNQLLAEAIPSLTWCMGSHESKGIDKDKNFNLPKLVDQVNWPRGKPDNVTPEWRHSDMREVAYLYQYGVFDKIIAISKP